MSAPSFRHPVFHYYRHFSQDVLPTPVDGGRVKEVVLCVAKLVQKGKISRIQLMGCHEFFRRGQGHTYEIHFQYGSRTLRRRFTAYRLNGVHSKSECYQVSDPHGRYLVVKIPPQPITDFAAYLKEVEHERSLAEKLLTLDIKVVVPCVGAVMRHVHPLKDAEVLLRGEAEHRHLEMLLQSGDKYADCFRVNGSFVFFMEFLDEPFLGRVVRDFYDRELLDTLQRQTFEKDVKLLADRDRLTFVADHQHIGSRHGLEILFAGLRRQLNDFCRQVDSVFASCSVFVGSRQKQEWFIRRALGEKVSGAEFFRTWQPENGDSEVLATRLDEVLGQELGEAGAMPRYVQLLQREARQSAFGYASSRMRKIGEKLLQLLAALEKIGLVLRDLKVDNLFIADDEMEVGLIDLETGGDVSTGHIEGIVPAGMPSNMTLSNLLFVEQLRRIYGESGVGTILHLQDWYATIAMMFEISIGITCFDEARHFILMLNQEIDQRFAHNYREFLAKHPDIKIDSTLIEEMFALPDEEIKGYTWQFWQLARRNLAAQCREHRRQLVELSYTLPPAIKKRLISNIEKTLTRTRQHYVHLSSQSKSVEALNHPQTTLADLQYHLILKEDHYCSRMSALSPEDQQRRLLGKEIEVYRGCIALKEKEALLASRMKLLHRRKITAFDLFPIMLDHVAGTMCRDEWRKCSRKLPQPGQRAKKSEEGAADNSIGWKSTVIPTKEEPAQRLLL
jgi:serine/threonine protein kinase